jgi:outer membrane murein-binding lipoprotein Lpp
MARASQGAGGSGKKKPRTPKEDPFSSATLEAKMGAVAGEVETLRADVERLKAETEMKEDLLQQRVGSLMTYNELLQEAKAKEGQ